MRSLLFISMLLVCVWMSTVHAQRRIKFDYDWKFKHVAPPACTDSNTSFPTNLDGQQCVWLRRAAPGSEKSADACARACCAMLQGCALWQFCNSSACGNQSCWYGDVTEMAYCKPGPGWISRSKVPLPAPENFTCTDPECKSAYEDSNWQHINLPHDFVVNGTFNSSDDMNHGYLPIGLGWYRKHFVMPSSAQGKYIWIDFDGVYRDSKIWLNGYPIGRHSSGYTSFYFELPEHVINWDGKDNVLVVYVNAVLPEGWFYEAGGIYRHVWLNIVDPLRVSQWGVHVTSKPIGSITHHEDTNSQSAASALVNVQTEIANSGKKTRSFILVSQVQSINGEEIASIMSNTTIVPGANKTIQHELAFNDVQLWSDKSPNLYNLVSSILVDNKLVDTLTTRFGVRIAVFDANRGFILNDQPVKIKGVCNHQDFAGVGSAMPERVNKFRVQKLLEMGANGWRMSHNPPNPELLDFTDELGMLVWDENRNFVNSTQYFQDQADMIRRDRNHPSIIIWSVCNELGCYEYDPRGEPIGQHFKDIIHTYDTSRPMGAGMAMGWGIGLSHVLDVQGINYYYEQYAIYHQSHPLQPIIGSETASCECARGIYSTNDTTGHISIYECDGCAQEWWTYVKSADYVAGGFSWTGFDYRGEPYPYSWPNIGSSFGAIDIAGFPKDTFYYYQSQYKKDVVFHLFPHWNWPGLEGQNISVWTYTNVPVVELFLNNQSLGKQSTPQFGHNQWDVLYTPGTILAVGHAWDGSEIIRSSIETTGQPARVVLEIEEGSDLVADEQDTALIKVSIVDAQNRFVQTASNYISFEIAGEGKIVGVGNGDPSSHEPDKVPGRSAFNGLARVLVQSTMTQGLITLVASSPGLESAKVTIFTSGSPPMYL